MSEVRYRRIQSRNLSPSRARVSELQLLLTKTDKLGLTISVRDNPEWRRLGWITVPQIQRGWGPIWGIPSQVRWGMEGGKT